MKISVLEKEDVAIRYWRSTGKIAKEISELLNSEKGIKISRRSVSDYLKKHDYKRLDSSLRQQKIGPLPTDILTHEEKPLGEKKVAGSKPRKLRRPQFKKKKEKDELGDIIQAAIARIEEEARNQ